MNPTPEEIQKILSSFGLTLPKSARPKDSVPLKFGLLLFPGFQALDVFGPIDVLNTLAVLYPLDLYILAETLDPVSTAPPTIFNPLRSNFAQSVVPTHTFDTAPPIDVLIVPGGPGSIPGFGNVQTAVDFIVRVFPSLQYLFTICTGSGTAARAGVLDGKRATTNKAGFMEIKKLNPNVNWIAQARWVADGKVWTTSGVTAGIDGILAWVGEIYGAEVADIATKLLEHERNVDSSRDPYAKICGLVN